MRDRMNVYFPPELLKQISELADRKKRIYDQDLISLLNATVGAAAA